MTRMDIEQALEIATAGTTSPSETFAAAQTVADRLDGATAAEWSNYFAILGRMLIHMHAAEYARNER